MSKRAYICVVMVALILVALPVFASETIPVTFSFQPPIPAATVTVAGTFNNWDATRNPMSDPDGDGIWTVVIELPPGSYEYKFVVNGDSWYEDPNAEESTDDGYGGNNSVVHVGVVSGDTKAGLKFDGWLESKIEKESNKSPVMYNDVYLKFSGVMRPGIETFTEVKAWKTLHIGSLKSWQDFLPLPVDGIEVNQATVTLRLVEGISTKLYFRGHAGNTKDHMTLIKSDGDEDKIWNRKAIEVLYSKAPIDGRLGLASLDGGKTFVYGEAQGEVYEGVTLGGLFTYETWPEPTRDDGEDHVMNMGAYATAKVNDYVTLRGQILQSRFTKLVSDENLPVLTEFIYEAGRESSGAEKMYIRGILGWGDDEMISMTQDAQGNWKAQVELKPGTYEYKFFYRGSAISDQWIGEGPGGDNWTRYVKTKSDQVFVLPENVPGPVKIKGSWDGWSTPQDMEKDDITGYWMITKELDPGTYQYGYEVGASGDWYGKGNNIPLMVGTGFRERGDSGLAYFAEVDYAKDLLGLKVGVKGAQAGVKAPYGFVGTDYRTIYGDAWYKVASSVKLTLYAGYDTNGVGDPKTGTTTIKPGFDISDPGAGFQYVKGSYEFKTGKDEVDTGYLETKYETAKLSVEFKNNSPDPNSIKLAVENDFPMDIWAKAVYFKKPGTKDYSLDLEAAKKLPFFDETKIGASLNLPSQKVVLKLTIDF